MQPLQNFPAAVLRGKGGVRAHRSGPRGSLGRGCPGGAQAAGLQGSALPSNAARWYWRLPALKPPGRQVEALGGFLVGQDTDGRGDVPTPDPIVSPLHPFGVLVHCWGEPYAGAARWLLYPGCVFLSGGKPLLKFAMFQARNVAPGPSFQLQPLLGEAVARAAAEAPLPFVSTALFPSPVHQRGMLKLCAAVMSEMSRITTACRSGGEGENSLA